MSVSISVHGGMNTITIRAYISKENTREGWRIDLGDRPHLSETLQIRVTLTKPEVEVFESTLQALITMAKEKIEDGGIIQVSLLDKLVREESSKSSFYWQLIKYLDYDNASWEVKPDSYEVVPVRKIYNLEELKMSNRLEPLFDLAMSIVFDWLKYDVDYLGLSVEDCARSLFVPDKHKVSGTNLFTQ